MAQLSLDDRIQERISSFASELSELVKRAALEAVEGALVQRRGPGRPRGSVAHAGTPAPRRIDGAGARRKGQKRDPRVLAALTERLHSYVKGNSGQRIEQIAQGLRTSTRELALPAKKLIGEKKIRTTGTRRATRYFSK